MRCLVKTIAAIFLIISLNVYADLSRELKQYISNENKKVEYKEILGFWYGNKAKKVPDYISKQQALKDIDMLEYLLETSYSGRKYWGNNGVDFPGTYKKLREFVNKQDEKVSVLEFENMITKSLKGIFDAHFAIKGKKSHLFYSHQDAYFTGILLEKQGDDYVVIESGNKQVPKGAKFITEEKDKYLFKTLAPTGKEHFLVGILSFGEITSLDLAFDSGKVTVPCHISLLNSNKKHKGKAISVYRKDNIAIVRTSNFSSRFDQELKKIESYGKELKNQEKFIWDLRWNCGGCTNYPMNFVENLNNLAEWKAYGARLASPGTLQSRRLYTRSERGENKKGILEAIKKEPLRKWNIIKYSPDNSKNGSYKGKMIVLVNKYVGSSGEAAVAYSYSVKNSLRIGENTAGAGTFGNVYIYYLPNSLIRLWLASAVIFTPGLVEGKGFMPDYWLDTDNPIDEIVRWLNTPDKYRFKFSTIQEITNDE